MTTTHRRYTKRQKATAVIAAEMSSVAAAAEQTGIPRTTVIHWMDEPEMVALRQKTREDLAEESMTLAHKALGEIRRRMGEFEPRDLTILYGVLTDKGQLLAGHSTIRQDIRVTDGMDDHETAALRRVLDDAMAGVS